MSALVLRVGILVTLCASVSCATSSVATRPDSSSASLSSNKHRSDIVPRVQRQYPPDSYVVDIGKGNSEKAASELARANLVKQLRVETNVIWSDLLRERGGVTEQEISRLIQTRVSELVQGIQIVEQGRDAVTGEAYAVAVLPKQEIARILESARVQEEVLSIPIESREPSDGIWVQAEGVVSFAEDTTVAEAKARSRDEARRKAVEKAVGVFVKGQTVVYNAQVADDLVRSLVRGIVIEEQTLEEGIRQLDTDPAAPKALYYATKLRVKVKPVRIERRGDFAVKADLNKTVFSEGEEMQIRAVATRDAYLHIFNVGQDDTVTVLLPSRYARANFVLAQKEFVFPDDEQRSMGIRLKAFPPAGAKKAIEKIKLVVTTKRIDLAQGRIPEGSFLVYQGKDTALVTDLLKTLSLLDESEWTEVTIPYEVRK